MTSLSRASTRARWLEAFRRIVALSAAMAAAPLLQSLLGLVDYLMVGPLGDQAVGGVGLGATLFLLLDTVLAGLSFGVQVQVASERGAGGDGRRGLLLGCTLLPAVSGLLALGACAIAPAFFAAQAASAQMGETALEYFQARAAGLPLLALVLGCRGYWFGHQQPWGYVRILGVSQLVNVALNWLLIHGELGSPKLGAAGSGWATSLSCAFAAAICIARLRAELGLRHWRGAWATLPHVLRVALPSILFGLLGLPGLGPVLLWILASVGESAVAAGAVLFQTTLLFALLGQGYGLASASMVSEALGRGSVDAARSEVRQVTAVVATTMGALGVALAASAHPMLGWFLHEPQTLSEASSALRLLGAAAPVLSMGLVLLFVLLATPYANRAAATPFVFLWVVAVPLVALLTSAGEIGLFGVFAWVLGGFLAQTAVLAAWWHGDGWARKVHELGAAAERARADEAYLDASGAAAFETADGVPAEAVGTAPGTRALVHRYGSR